MNFYSDNASGAHPKIMDALVKANSGASAPYGDDDIMDHVRAQIRDIFEAPEADIFLVATGTAANSLALASLVSPWDIIYCHDTSHIRADECGAPEFYTGGARLVGLGSNNGKVAPADLEKAITNTPVGDVHTYQRGAVSITNTSEVGTVYSPGDVKAIGDVAQSYGLPMHMDGARFANALVHAGCSPAELTWKAGVNVLSFGGTKNGLLGVEAVILFDKGLAPEFALRRKRGGHLFSKHRYLAAQMQTYLADDLWLDLARQANRQAARLSAGLAAIDGVKLANKVQANMLFISATRAKHRQAQSAGADYALAPFGTSLEGDDDEILQARLVCSWSTTDAETDALIAALTG